MSQNKTLQMPDNFYALLANGGIRKISLVQTILPRIRAIFINNGEALLDQKDEIEFDGNYRVEDDEVLFVNMELPDEFNDIISNPTGLKILDLSEDKIKAVFWFDNSVFYFQNFDSRKLLRNRNVLVYNRNTYDAISNDAFIIDNSVNAVYSKNKFYFLSYANANRIFNLSAFYVEATDADVDDFRNHATVAIEDDTWFKDNANSVIRKQITLIQKSNILDGANTKKIKTRAKKFGLLIDLDDDEKIKFPCDKRNCRDILLFLNEQYYSGLISGTPYKTSSKIKVNINQ
jgi:hypothetical protein